MTDRSPTVTLEPASKADQPLIRGWLARPDIEEWWGPRSSTEAAVTLAMSAEHAITRLIAADGVHYGGKPVDR